MVNVILDPRSNELVTPSTTREGWGQVCLQSTQTVINNGIVNSVKRMAWVKGPVELLAKEFKLGATKNGKIIRINLIHHFMMDNLRLSIQHQEK